VAAAASGAASLNHASDTNRARTHKERALISARITSARALARRLYHFAEEFMRLPLTLQMQRERYEEHGRFQFRGSYRAITNGGTRPRPPRRSTFEGSKVIPLAHALRRDGRFREFSLE